LLVEDNEQVRDLGFQALTVFGYRVFSAKDGPEALRILSSMNDTAHLLLTDVVMPGMNGRELYEKAIERRPDLRVLYMSGYTENVIAHHGVLKEGVQFIQKPFSVLGLAAKVREVLEA
jgi:DNA-binding NtrC family response regulator